jgi:4a-hydroxytetrahydrobiopterin dehydratase
MARLKDTPCEPCAVGAVPLSEVQINALLKEIPGWEIITEEGANRLRRTFTFPDFRKAQAFALRVGDLAEAGGHHPRLVRNGER